MIRLQNPNICQILYIQFSFGFTFHHVIIPPLRFSLIHPVIVNTGADVCDDAAVGPDAHTAHPGRQHLQLLGRGTAPSGGCRQKDRGRLPDSMGELLVPTTARLNPITQRRQTI